MSNRELMEGITVGNLWIFFHLIGKWVKRFLVTATKNRVPLLANVIECVAQQSKYCGVPVFHHIVGDDCRELDLYKDSIVKIHPHVTIWNLTEKELDMDCPSLPSRLSALR